jgi:hypothetical protein
MVSLVLLFIPLSSCFSPTAGKSPTPAPAPTYSEGGQIEIHNVKLPDGRSVICVSNKRGYSGGISCDWEHVKDKSK